MKRLIDDLLEYAEFGQGSALPSQKLTLDNVLAETVANLKRAIDEENASVRVDNLPTVAANKANVLISCRNTRYPGHWRIFVNSLSVTQPV